MKHSLSSLRQIWPGSLLACALALSGCRQSQAPAPIPAPSAKIDYTAELPRGQMALRKIDPSQYPDFARGLAGADLASLRRAIDNSLTYFAKPGSVRGYPYLDISRERVIATLKQMRALLDEQLNEPAFNAAVAQRFDVYQSVGAPKPDQSGFTNKVLFTGYFTPTYEASLTRGAAYQWPIYRRPPDLISDESGEGAGRKMPDGKVVAYYTRQQIESGQLTGQELAWVTSRWNAYVITIQGSARLKLPDGRIDEVGYAGTNGWPYPDPSPGKQMLNDGVISKDQASLQGLKQYFDSHPDQMNHYLWLNNRTVFFTERPGGPFGSLNVPVTPFCSIATDKKVYPAGLLAFLSVPIPVAQDNFPGAGAPTASGATRPFSAFVLDQDKGGAIRSAGRCDIFMGIGEQAEEISGHEVNPGELYYLAAKKPSTPAH